ncbi:hypothetical protein TELCIR_08829 [Teladorsagia circumcincta]|uniref:Uncharacterized protein n=1 Tax=Teladorsagia circumcincta TaxID=45464 RepID=A0A2G9UGJ3_TELCI|nr:hypothetical protein TELCIR_08829 [Teladorsagia circumcincta]
MTHQKVSPGRHLTKLGRAKTRPRLSPLYEIRDLEFKQCIADSASVHSADIVDRHPIRAPTQTKVKTENTKNE